jgi:drug/metabolite transporter (DMT)-like permease
MFSSNLVIARYGVESVAPWTLAFLRWSLAALVLTAIAWPELVRHRAALLAQARPIAALAVFGMVVCGGGVYVALTQTTAVNATLVYSSAPALIVALEFLFRGHRASLRQGVGIALAFLGVATVALEGDPTRILELRFNPGDLGIALAALSWAIYTVVLRRPGLTALPGRPLFAAIALAGAAMLLPFAAMEAALGGPLPAGADWLTILALVLIPSLGAYSAYQYSVKALGPTNAGLALYLAPISGVLMAVVGLGEAFRAFHVAGLLLVVSGIGLATAPRHLLRRLLSRPSL